MPWPRLLLHVAVVAAGTVAGHRSPKPLAAVAPFYDRAAKQDGVPASEVAAAEDASVFEASDVEALRLLVAEAGVGALGALGAKAALAALEAAAASGSGGAAAVPSES